MSDKEKLKKLRTAATALYFAGRWELPIETMAAARQVRLWEDLRDALELGAGAATNAGVHEDTWAKLAIAYGYESDGFITVHPRLK